MQQMRLLGDKLYSLGCIFYNKANILQHFKLTGLSQQSSKMSRLHIEIAMLKWPFIRARFYEDFSMASICSQIIGFAVAHLFHDVVR